MPTPRTARFVLTALLLIAVLLAATGPRARAEGFLTGRHVYVSAGHGWYYNGAYDAWMVQRGNTNNIVEDLSNTEAVNLHLLQYLQNAGAAVWPCRESDLNPRMVIVDDQDGSSRPDNGTYSETGAWSEDSSGGFVNFRWPYQDGHQVFADYASGGRGRLASIASPASASAVWTPNLPSAGYYSVSVSYSSGASRASCAHYIVRHTGGVTHVYVDQTRHGSTWVPLGTFHFQAGLSPAAGSVMLLNGASGTGTVSADAVRFGGGTGIVDRGSGVSGYPRFEEAGRYFTFFAGAPAFVYDPVSSCYDAQTSCGAGDDASARPRYAAWQHLADEDAVYLSWHSNAGGGRGTSSFYHSTLSAESQSALLTAAVHNQIVAGIRAQFDPSWPDRGIGTLALGELSPSNNPEMPAALIEVAFHDDATDALSLRNPCWRRAVARSVYQGIAKYYAARDGVTPCLLPEPPVNLAVRNTGTGQVRLSWSAGPSGGPFGDPAASYIVYRSPDGLGFDSGRAAADASFTDTVASSGQLYYYRVAAVNAGGVSLPSETLAVRIAPGGTLPEILIVNGYDREDRTLVSLKASGREIGSPARERPEWVNTFNYVIQHASSLHRLGKAFDSASNEAVSSGDVDLNCYALVDWAAGRQANVVAGQPATYHAFTAVEQALIRAYAQAGGHLFVSGAEILYDLDRDTDPADVGSLFVREVLKVRYGGDDANTYQVTGTAVPFTPLPDPPPASPGGAVSYALSTGTLYIPDGYQPPQDNADVMVHFHGADSVALQNLLQSGKSGVLIVINYGGLSAAYSAPFADRHLFRSILVEARDRLTEVYGRPIGIGRLALTSFSAGYGALRQILKYPEYDGMITDIVMADSLYAGYVMVNGQTVPDPNQIRDFVRMALRAAHSRITFTMTYSQLVPGTYASTRECADAIIAAVGASRVAASGADATGMTLESTVDLGLLRIRSYQGTTGDDHMLHLTQMQEALKLTGFPAAASTGVFGFSNGSGAMYDVAFPDRVIANGGQVAQNYVGGTADGAAAVFSGDWRVVFLGYPFETLLSRDARDNVMEDAVRFLLPPAGSVGINISGLPASAKPGQALPLQWTPASSLDFPLSLDLWATLTHSSGRPSYVFDLLRNMPLPAGGSVVFPCALTVPAGAPSGAYTVALFQGDYRRHVINQRVSPITIAADQGFSDEFTGGTLNSANWILAGTVGGQPSVASGRLGIAYSGSGGHAGSDLITAQAFDGQMSVSVGVTPVVPSSGIHESGVALVAGQGLPMAQAATAKLALTTDPGGGVTAVWTVRTPGASEAVQQIVGLSSGPVALSVWRSGGQVQASYDAGAGPVAMAARDFPFSPGYGWLFAGGSPGAGGAYFDWAGAGGESAAAHPVSAGSIGQARLAPEGHAWLLPLAVTAGAGDPFAAVQMPDRSAGALANWTALAELPVPARGSRVTVFCRVASIGGAGTVVPFRYVEGASQPALPLFCNTRDIVAAAGPDRTGLLMSAAGRVISVDQTRGVFMLDDGGRELAVRYSCTGLTLTPPSPGSFAVVTGVVSGENAPVLLLRSQDDLAVL